MNEIIKKCVKNVLLKKENMLNQNLAEEIHKSIIRKIEKTKSILIF